MSPVCDRVHRAIRALSVGGLSIARVARDRNRTGRACAFGPEFSDGSLQQNVRNRANCLRKAICQNRSATVSVECYSQVIVETVGPRGRSKVLDVNSSKLSETTEVSPELSSERNEVAGSEAFDQELRRSLRDGGMEVESESDVFFSEGMKWTPETGR